MELRNSRPLSIEVSRVRTAVSSANTAEATASTSRVSEPLGALSASAIMIGMATITNATMA